MKMRISEIECPPPRESHTEDGIRQLAADIEKHGLLHPPVVTKGKKLVAGMGRILAAKLLGWEEIEVRVIDGPVSDLRATTLCENLHRTDMSGWEKWQALSELMCMHQDRQLKDLAEEVSLSQSLLTRYLSPSKCIGAWQDALKAGKVGISDCYAASKLPEAEQAGLLALKLSGMSRDNLERHSRRQRVKPSVKVDRVKIALPKSVSVVLSGNNLAMMDVVDILSDALKEARKASEQYDVKTFQSMMRDRAKLQR
jgi:ParB/RepB/Spo0J family partition protein